MRNRKYGIKSPLNTAAITPVPFTLHFTARLHLLIMADLPPRLETTVQYSTMGAEEGRLQWWKGEVSNIWSVGVMFIT